MYGDYKIPWIFHDATSLNTFTTITPATNIFVGQHLRSDLHIIMTSSPTSSASDSSSSPNSSPTLAKFNPFAVHPFTNCSASQNESHPRNHQFSTYGYPYGPLGNYNSLHNPTPQQQAPPGLNTPNKSSTKSSVNAYVHPPRPAIFIPFRQDTSSPELPDILKSKSSTTNSDSRTFSSISYPSASGNTTTPTSYPQKFWQKRPTHLSRCHRPRQSNLSYFCPSPTDSFVVTRSRVANFCTLLMLLYFWAAKPKYIYLYNRLMPPPWCKDTMRSHLNFPAFNPSESRGCPSFPIENKTFAGDPMTLIVADYSCGIDGFFSQP